MTKIAECALCKETKELQVSHLMPAGVLKKVGKAHNSKVAVAEMDSQRLVYQSRQSKKELLCSDCEQVLNQGGEKYIIPKLFDQHGFALLDEVKANSAYSEEGQLVIVDGIDFTPHRHFCLGYLWKESITAWSDPPEPSVGSLIDFHLGIQSFLLGKSQMPEQFRIAVIVYRDASAMTGSAGIGITADRKWFSFMVPGMRYELYTDEYPIEFAAHFAARKMILVVRDYIGSKDHHEFLRNVSGVEPRGSVRRDLDSGLFDAESN